MPFIWASVGALLGSIILSALTVLYHWIFFRPSLGDGQYAFVFLVTVPFGAILGALSASIWAQLRRAKGKIAGRLGVWGGGFLAALFLYFGLFEFCRTENPTVGERVIATLYWFAVPLLWSFLLIRIGLRTRAKL